MSATISNDETVEIVPSKIKSMLASKQRSCFH